MKKIIFCVIAVLALMSGSCQRNKLLLGTNGENGSRIPSDTLILVSETQTFGQWFTLVISADGEVVYTPTEYTGYNRENLPPQGVPIKSRISREQLEEIIREFENQKFFSLDDSYNCGYSPDGAVRTVSIEIGGRKKSVRWRECKKDGKNFPPEFFAVFDKINEVRNRKQ